MENRERPPFTPTDLCALIAHETAAILYDAGTDGIPSTETLREGLTVLASAGRVSDISVHLAWIDSELHSAREFERTGRDTPHLLDPDRLNAVPDASIQMEAVWEIFRAAVRMPVQRDRRAMLELAVTLADMGGLADVLPGTPLPEGPRLTAAALRAELAEVGEALGHEQTCGPLAEIGGRQ